MTRKWIGIALIGTISLATTVATSALASQTQYRQVKWLGQKGFLKDASIANEKIQCEFTQFGLIKNQIRGEIKSAFPDFDLEEFHYLNDFQSRMRDTGSSVGGCAIRKPYYSCASIYDLRSSRYALTVTSSPLFKKDREATQFVQEYLQSNPNAQILKSGISLLGYKQYQGFVLELKRVDSSLPQADSIDIASQ